MEQILISVRLKDDKLREQFCLINPRLRSIILDLAFLIYNKYEDYLLISELFSDTEGTASKHGRGAKISITGKHLTLANFSKEQAGYIISHVNEHFPYYSQYPKSDMKTARDCGDHILIQVKHEPKHKAI